MRWQRKAAIQRWLSRLPAPLGDALYFAIQRTFGRVQESSPFPQLRGAARIIDLLAMQQRSVEGRTILEVGTGRSLGLPLGFWLCGAERLVTVDLNPLLSDAMVRSDLAKLRAKPEELRAIFGTRADARFEDRLARLLTAQSLADVLRIANIEYLAPADASALRLSDGSIDYHVSFTVLEHIPADVLRAILVEGRRLLRADGLFAHMVDLSDHFAHADRSINGINFLRFTEREWQHYAGNRFMYMNRLRVHEVLQIFEQAGVKIVHAEPFVSEKSLELLRAGFPLDERFRGNDDTTNATLRVDVVGRRRSRRVFESQSLRGAPRDRRFQTLRL
ncbi:MAG TPA: class I SAM-dependent methyltransferase [Thermoanaerobaculia bacterium]|nr:class I SAM-dependent methyltransferase [Thermoanaerobaculia bacterium]